MTTQEVLIEGIARGIQRTLEDDKYVERIADKTADAIALHFELLTPRQAAVLLDVTKETLQINHIEWGLDKSLAFGPKNPRYFLSQVLERARTKILKGRPVLAKIEEAYFVNSDGQRISGCSEKRDWNDYVELKELALKSQRIARKTRDEKGAA